MLMYSRDVTSASSSASFAARCHAERAHSLKCRPHASQLAVSIKGFPHGHGRHSKREILTPVRPTGPRCEVNPMGYRAVQAPQCISHTCSKARAFAPGTAQERENCAPGGATPLDAP